jgi:hypothetical protein
MTTFSSAAWAGTCKPRGTTSLLQELQAQLPPTFDYYVSSLNGNDANDGRTIATAKKTIMGSADGPGAQSLLGAGKSLGLEYGSHFREQLTITWPDVRVGAYGVGDLPVLDASDILPNNTITKTADLYQFSVLLAFDTDGREFPFSVFENGQRLRRADSLKESAEAAGSFYAQQPSDPTSQPWTIYLHAINSANPITNGSVYEVAIRDAGFDTADAATGLQLSNIHAKRSILNDGVLRIRGKNSVISACVAEDGTKHTLYVTDKCLLEDVVCWKGEGRDSYFIYYYENANSDSMGTTFRRCVAIGDYAYGQQESRYATASGYYCHAKTNPLVSVLYEECYAENFSAGFGGEAQQTTVLGCFTYLTATGASGSSYSGQVTTIKGNFFDQRAGASYQKALNEQRTLLRAQAGTTNINHNVLLTSIIPDTYGFCLFSGAPDPLKPYPGDTIINFTRNTMLNEGTGNGQGLRKLSQGSLTFDHNIFYNIREVCMVENSTLTSFNNVYWRPNNGPMSWFFNGNPYTPLSAWKQFGQDTDSTDTIDPAFLTPVIYWRTVGNATPGATLDAGATS